MVIKIVGNKIMVPLIPDELKCVSCKRNVLDAFGIGVESKTYFTTSGIVCSDCYRYNRKVIYVYEPGEYPYIEC